MNQNISVKIITVILSSIAFSVSYGVILYFEQVTPVDDILHYSFITICGYLFIPSFFLYFIFGGGLTPILDKFIRNLFKNNKIKMAISMVISYLGLAIAASIVISITFSNSFILLYYVYLSIICALIFLSIQTFIKWIIH